MNRLCIIQNGNVNEMNNGLIHEWGFKEECLINFFLQLKFIYFIKFNILQLWCMLCFYELSIENITFFKNPIIIGCYVKVFLNP
jgi:hypothetical protein